MDKENSKFCFIVHTDTVGLLSNFVLSAHRYCGSILLS